MRRELLGTGLKVALVRMIGMGVGFSLTIVLARTIGPNGLGFYAYALSLLMLAAVPTTQGWATVLLRETSKAATDQVWSSVRGLIKTGGGIAGVTAICGLIIGLVVSVVSSSEVYSKETVLLLAIILFLDQISALRLAVLRGLDLPVWGQIPEMLVRPALILAIFVLLTSVSAGPVSVISAFVALLGASLLTTLFGIVILKWKAPQGLLNTPPKNYLTLWFQSAVILAGNSWLVILNSQIDFLVLGVLGTAEQLGYYRVAVQIALLSGTAYVALNMIAMQRFTRLYATSQTAELQTAATFMSRIAFAATLPLPVIFWFAGEDILAFVVGTEFRVANDALLLLLVVQSGSAFAGFAQTLLVMAKKERKIIPGTIASVLLNLVICVVLVPVYQMEGAAISVVASILTWNLFLWHKCRTLIGIDSSILGLKNR